MPWNKSMYAMALNTPLFLVIKVNNAIVTKNFSAGTNNEDLKYAWI